MFEVIEFIGWCVVIIALVAAVIFACGAAWIEPNKKHQGDE